MTNAKVSAGTLLYRKVGESLEVLIVKPSGPAARWGWSIPKGLPDDGEDLVTAARRETLEEAGCEAPQLDLLGHVDYVKSKKRVYCFYGPAAAETNPRAASWEVSEARFLPASEARSKLHQDQKIFIDWLEAKLAQE